MIPKSNAVKNESHIYIFALHYHLSTSLQLQPPLQNTSLSSQTKISLQDFRLPLRAPINPSHVPQLPRKRILKHLLQALVRLILGPVHHDRDVTLDSTGQVEAGTVVSVLSHGGVGVDARIRGAPFDVAAGPDGVVEVAVCKDGAVQRVPGTAEGTLAGDGEGGVCFLHVGVVDVNALCKVS